MSEHLYPSQLDLMDLTYFGGMAASAVQNPLVANPIRGLTVVEGEKPAKVAVDAVADRATAREEAQAA